MELPYASWKNQERKNTVTHEDQIMPPRTADSLFEEFEQFGSTSPLEVWEFVKVNTTEFVSSRHQDQDTMVDVPEFMKVLAKTLEPYLDVLDAYSEKNGEDDNEE